jgi:putative ABC transport system permease protein
MDEFFLSVSMVTLLLGGIGVMNIMLIAVRERTREIGVRKALGATSAAVQGQFLSEGVFLTLSSGLMGFVVAWGLCALVNRLPLPARFSGMIITWPTVAFSIAALVAIGAAASAYPARRAAALPPVEALRFDT